MAPAMQPAEIQFAQRLASNEKGIRDRAVKKLRQYISVKTQRETGGFSQEELLKIWKGLFYCMWVQDEPLLQEELANTISQLIHVVNNSEAQHLFIQTFWQTVNREWEGIDRLRLDKYCMLTRLVLRQSFEVLKRNGWEESQIKLFLDVLMKEILHPESQSPNGVKFHFIDIYLDELSKVGGKELLGNQNLKFIDPFCKIAAKTKDHTLVQRIARGVFEVIVDQSSFVPEEMVEEQRTKVGDGEFSEEEISENEMMWRKTISKKKTALGKHHSRKDGISNEERDSCGTCEDPGPLLQFDYKAVADRLLEITNRKNIPPFNKKCLSKLIKKFQDLSEGSTTQLGFMEDISANEDGHPISQGKKKKGNKPSEKTHLGKQKGNKFFHKEEEENEGSTQKRKRKKKKKNHLQTENLGSGDKATSSDLNGCSTPEENEKIDNNGASVVEMGTDVFSSTAEENDLEHPPTIPICNKKRRPRKKSLRVQERVPGLAVLIPEDMTQSGPSIERAQETATCTPPTGGIQVLKRKRKLGALPVNGSSLSMLTWPPPGKESPPTSPGAGEDGHPALAQGVRLKRKKGAPSSLDLYDLANPKNVILKKRKKMKEMLHLVEHNGVLETEVKQIHTLGNSGAFSPLKKKKLRAENDFVKFDTPFLPKPLFFRKAKSAASISFLSPTVQLNKTPSSSKKVTFGLNRNMTAEFKKTDKSILVSPTGPSRVAFNPEQKPLHGVLKTPTSSPSNTPLAPKKILTTPPKRRPTAMDFF
ncbi:ribosomal RNA processing protein 1 homolog B [Orycteropus afer afer]|uniref:Ribosomal RNA processing protein 1 homolog B n=1 Tax=Orycteropus afer afer TaxID=1230840 RepID=A0AC54ZAC4_ORYAF|nr:ribosomal RNA processing protein 1 homolog B [Orycteropus afer afer]